MDNIIKVYFLWVAVTFGLLLSLFSCGGPKNLYLERYTQDPQPLIDSISREHKLNTLNSYKEWDKSFFYGNDSIATNAYSIAFIVRDSTYIMSVTEKENQNKVLFRFRKEVK